MELPDMVGDKNEGYVVLLFKLLYGLKQVSRIWVETLTRELKVLEFIKLEIEYSIYTLIS